jgi:hypothetical protein
MATTMAWGEEIQVFMELGFLVNFFTLDDATLGVLDGEGRLDGTLIGDDVSEYVQDISISRGRSDQLQVFNAGTASITLLNNDRRFDPINESSPYWNDSTNKSGVTPRRKVTIISDGITIFSGRITDIDVVYSPQRPDATIDNSTVVITVADDFVLLANTYIGNAITPSAQLSGTRVTTILDLPEVAYPATRNIDAGTATLGGGATFDIAANTNVLSYLQNVALAEQGYFFVAGNGDITFTDRVTAAFASISATFSDQVGTDLPYTGLAVLYGQEFLYNKVVASVLGGADQTANDVASQTEYGISTLNLSDLLLNNDTAALVLATELLDRYKEPQYRFDKLQTIYNMLDAGQQTDVTSLEIADVIEITRTYPTGSPASVTLLYSVESIKHSITPSNHRVEIGLAVADLVFPFELFGYPLAITRTNLVPNPNFESSVTGWVASATATVAHSASDFFVPSGSALITVNAGSDNVQGISKSGLAVVVGSTYTLSLYAKNLTGVAGALFTVVATTKNSVGGTTGVFVSSDTTMSTTSWTRGSVSFVVPANSTTVDISVRYAQTTVGAITFLVDAVLLEASATVLPYFDGNHADTYTDYGLTSIAWNGTIDNSSSTSTWTTGTTRTNLFYNSSFETADLSRMSGLPAGAAIVNTEAFYGTHSLSMASNFSSFNGFAVNVVNASRTYTGSVYVKSSTTSISVRLAIRYFNPLGGTVGTTFGSFSSTVVGSWIRYSVTVAIPAGVSIGSVALIAQRTGTGDATLVYFDGFLLEESATVLPYFDFTLNADYTGYTPTEEVFTLGNDGFVPSSSWVQSSLATGSILDSDFALT